MRIASVVSWATGLVVIGILGRSVHAWVDDPKAVALAAARNLADQPGFAWSTASGHG